MATPPAAQVSQLQVAGVYALSSPGKAVTAACPTADHLLAFAANSFAVVYDTSTDEQVQLLRSTSSNQPLQCLAWSPCGAYLAAGEAGINPMVFVWEVGSRRCVHELKGHKSTVGKLCFSPDGKLLASVGCGADGQLCLWDWHTGGLQCKQKVAVDLSSVVFTEDSSHILAAGKNTLKSWSLSWTSPRPRRSRSSSGGGGSGIEAPSGLSLTARQVNLKQQRSSSFVDMCLAPCAPGQPVGSNGVYALTDKGNLMLLRSTGRTVDRAINLQVPEAYGLTATARQVACACAQGTVRLFASKTLQFRANLPYWSPAGASDNSLFPDARACTFGSGSQADSMLLVVYADSDMILWSLEDMGQIQPVRSFASHTGAIWDVAPFTLLSSNAGSSSGGGAGSVQATSQAVSGCATCSADGSIRFWDLSAAAGTAHPLQSITVGSASAASSSSTQASRAQLRCLRISQDGSLLAAGDTAGNVHVYNVATLQPLAVQEAHAGDVLCLDFSAPAPAQSVGGGDGASTSAASSSSSSRRSNGSGLAVSGGRDMLIHVYDASNGFRLLETLDEHTAAVTAVRFTAGGKGLVSCGADHSIIFRALSKVPGAGSAYSYRQTHRETLQHTLLYDLAVGPLDAFVLTADQGGVMRLWDATSGSVLRSIQPEVGAGQVVRLCMDPGGVTAICCHSDGCVRIYGLQSGQLMWRAWGHASHVAAAAFSPDLSRLLSVGGDGCMLVWELPHSLAAQLQAAAAEVAAARQQAGCQVLSPQVAGAQRASLSGTPAASPSVAGGVSLGTPVLQPGSSSLGSRATPGSCVSEGGIGSTLRRIQQGEPLVSADKLPRWARSPTAAATAAAQQHSSDGGGAGSSNAQAQQQQQQQRPSKWLSGRQQQPDAFVRAAGALSDPGVQVEPAHAPEPTASADAAGAADAGVSQQQQQPQMPWHCRGSRVLIRHWQDGSTFSSEAATAAAAAAAACAAAGREAAIAEEACEAQAEADEPAHSAEQQGDLPEKTQASPAGQGGAGAVVRDLFKSHFSSLQQAIRGPTKTRGASEEDDCLSVQQDRQSFSTKFKKDRSSLSQVCSPAADQTAAAGGAADALPPGTSEQSTGLTPQGSKLFRAASTQPPAPAASPAAAAALPSLSLGGVGVGGGDVLFAAAAGEGRAAVKRPCSQEASPREKRWRQGQMKPELAGLWEKLEHLQAEFVHHQQVRASPVRPKSSLGHASPTQQQQQQMRANRRRSDSSAGGILQQQQQPPASPQQQQQQHRLPVAGGATSSSSQVPAVTPPPSPGRLTPSRMAPAAAGKSSSSSRQPWASPAALGSGKPVRRAIRHTPVSSPSLRRQQQGGGSRPAEAGEEPPGPVFGSRTLARSLQRRRSSAADDAAAAAAAADPSSGGVHEQGSGAAEVQPVQDKEAAAVAADLLPAAEEDSSSAAAAAAEALSPAAAAPGEASPPAAAAAAPAGRANSALMAALFGDDSPGPSPATAAASNEQVNSPGELARLLGFASSPEASPVQLQQQQQPSPAADTPGSSSPVPHASPVRRSLPRLDEVLRQGSRSPSLSEPSEASSPGRGYHQQQQQQHPSVLRSPLASSCSPQQRQQQGSDWVARARASPSGIPSLQAGSRKLRELSGRLDVSSECRVSIGTSIAARSPSKGPSAGSPLAQAPPQLQQSQPAAPEVAAAAAVAVAGVVVGEGVQGTVAVKAELPAEGRRSSIDLTPVPVGGLFYPAEDTPKANLGGALTASAAPAPAAPLPAAPPQQQQQALVAAGEYGAAASKAGVTVTPAGHHQVWPAWGAEAEGGCWEVTPSPAADLMKKMWPAAGSGAAAAASGGVQAGAGPTLMHSNPVADAAGTTDGGSSSGGAAERPADATAAAGGDEAPLLASGSSYWVAQNPCYDMTPHGSAGRSSRHPEGLLRPSDPDTPGMSDASPASSLQSHPVRGLSAAARTTGDSAAQGAAVSPEGSRQSLGGMAAVAPASAAGATQEAGAVAVQEEEEGGVGREPLQIEGSRYTSCASATSTPASAGGAAPAEAAAAGTAGQLLLPATPRSACDSSLPGSEPGSVASSSKRHSSAGRRFSGRGLQALLGHSPGSPGPDSGDCRPGSPAGMLGLLQRMRLGRSSKGKTKSGSSAGGCMSPQVTGDDGDSGRRLSGGLRYLEPQQQQQQQQQQPGWSGNSGGCSALSADDVQVELSAKSAASVVQTPSRAAGAAAGGGAAALYEQQSRVVPGPEEIAAKVSSFKLQASCFKQSLHEMQQLLRQLEGLQMDPDSTRQVDRLLTPPAAASHSPHSRQQAADREVPFGQADAHHHQQQQQSGSTCSSNSSCAPVMSVQQRVQQELLETICEISSMTGVPLPATTGSGMTGSSSGTPAWIAAHGGSSPQQHQLLAHSPGGPTSLRAPPVPAAAGSTAGALAMPAGLEALIKGAGLQPPGQNAGMAGSPADVDLFMGRIAELVMQRMGTAPPGRPGV